MQKDLEQNNVKGKKTASYSHVLMFTGIFMAMLAVVGNTLSGMTAYNEYITDVIIAVIVYLSAFSLVIRMWLTGRKKAETPVPPVPAEPEQKGGEDL